MKQGGQTNFFSGLTPMAKIVIFMIAFISVALIMFFSKSVEESVGTEDPEHDNGGLEDEEHNEEIMTIEENGDRIHIPDQEAGERVLISEMFLNESRWIVIHEDSDGEPGNILGAGLFGREETTGRVELLRSTVSGEPYHAVIYVVADREEDRDRLFDTELDTPLVSEGEVVISTFVAL